MNVITGPRVLDTKKATYDRNRSYHSKEYKLSRPAPETVKETAKAKGVPNSPHPETQEFPSPSEGGGSGWG